MPTLAMSPETKAVDETTGLPTFAPALSTIWNEVPLYVPVQPSGVGLQSGSVSVSQVMRE